MRKQRARGFSLLELMIVLAIICAVSAAAMISLSTVRNATAVNDAYSMVTREVQIAHQLAMDQRCIAYLKFDPSTETMRIQTIKGTVYKDYETVQTLPNGVQFTTFVPMPATAPESFGTGSYAVDFGIYSGGGKTGIYFQPDGTALDADPTLKGQLNNGVVYFGRPNQIATARAVSLMGATGRVKGWRVVSVAGVPTWK